MFVPRAVKRSGPVSTNRNKKLRTTISTFGEVHSTSSIDSKKEETTDLSVDLEGVTGVDSKIEHVDLRNEKILENKETQFIIYDKHMKSDDSEKNVIVENQLFEKESNNLNVEHFEKNVIVKNQLFESDNPNVRNSEKNVIVENQLFEKESNNLNIEHSEKIESDNLNVGGYSEKIKLSEKESEQVQDTIEQEEPVKEFSYQQRAAFAGQPICVICGKYGEYICDETDHDVCSLECKKKDIENVKIIQTQSILQTPGLFHAQLTGYIPDTFINSLTEFQIQSILKRNQINVEGKNIPKPILSFTQCKLPKKMMENLQLEGYIQPTSVQIQTIPTALIGRDILASGQTGSGKTASFLIPIISHCYSLSQCYEGKNGPYVIILTPTRELCSQIENLTKRLSKGLLNMKTALLVGGLPMPNQVHRLKQGIQIAIATPGRLIDILSQHNKELSMNSIHMFVLDEVDMMFKMGFENQVKDIINKLPLPATNLQRQTLMFSATIPENIEKLAKSLLKDHIRIVVGFQKNKNENLESSLSISIPIIPVKQTILWVENQSKKKQLFSLLNDPKYYKPPIVIFVESKIGADLLSKAIEKKCNARSVSIHGDKSQEERITTLQSFLNGEYEIIVSTGILSRGLNLPDVKLVINFDMATSVDEYIHQVGRAAGNESSGNSGFSSGWAITFINEDHKHLFKKFVSTLKAQPAGKVTPLPSKLLGHGYTLYGNNKSSSRK